ncbi:transglycosylase SLT domain-containing protein [Cupriavidus basilensis]|uniref:Transglycosylase SLT domain-containing protein n=1 Tax=Cupriavidus basilensis TaxID=68895 RepID=A0A643G4M2_9BURK|nr:transglycosylase SLT domain-containing protein [Cupriavidus basilensis]QOT75053.1 transglycosylase SLT domain-containing protein [Cupriavidus basilensis]
MANTFTITIAAVDRATATVRKINQSMARLTSPVRDLGQSLGNLGREVGIDRVSQSLGKVASSARSAVSGVTSLVPALGVIGSAATVAGIGALASNWGKLGAEIARTSAVLGVSTSDLQAYQAAARLAGGTAEDMTSSLKSLGDTLEDAAFNRNPQALVLMNQLGISMTKTKGGAVDATRALRQVAEAIARQKGNVQAQRLIARTFGVEQLLPMLQKGAAGIEAYVAQARSLGTVMGPDKIAAAKEYAQNMTKLDLAIDGLKSSVGNALIPALSPLLQDLSEWVTINRDLIATNVGEFVKDVATWIKSVDWGKVTKGTGDFVDALGGVKGVAIAIAAITFAAPIAGVATLIGSLSKLALVAIPAAAKGLAALGGVGAAGLGTLGTGVVAGAAGYGLGSLIRPQFDDYVKWASGGERWSLRDYFTGTNRHALKDTGGYTQEEIDSVKSSGGVRLSADARSRLAAGEERNAPPAGASGQKGSDLFSRLESQYGLPSGLLDSVWATESSRGTGKMVSPAGAKGHFQFMDATAKQYGVTNPFDLGQSATGAAKMYSDLLKSTGGDLPKALAAYNWGIGNVQRQGIEHAPAETQGYIKKVMAGMGAEAPMSSVYAKSPDAAGMAGRAIASGSSDGYAGKALVEIVLTGAPQGTRTSVKSTGNVEATTRVRDSMLTDNVV